MIENEKLFGNFFHYGASMAPYAKSMDWDMDEWESDLQNFKKMNFSTARIFVPWDRIEIREGEFDWRKQDHFLECALKNHVRVLLAVGGVFDSMQGIYAPAYLRKKKYFPRQPEAGNAPYNDGPLFTVCMDNEDYHEKALSFIAQTVRRYAKHPAVCGWCSWNEPWTHFCYCPATVARFRRFAEKKYRGNISALNQTWGTEFPVDYVSFDELNPPAGSGFIGGLNAMLDWFEFTQENMMEHLESVYRVIKDNDPDGLPVTGNLGFSHGINAIAGYMIPERMRKCFDIGGFSYYTVAHLEGTGSLSDLFRTAAYLEVHRWISRDPLQRTLALESEAGPNQEMLTPARRRFNNYIALGHNAKSMILWNYRTRISDNQVGNFNLMAWDGAMTERAAQHAEFAKNLHRHAEFLNHACTVTGKAAVLYDNRLRRASAVSRSNDWSENRWEGALRILWDLNIPMDGWMPEHGPLDVSRCKLLLISSAEFMNEEIATAIRDFVREGGTVIAETPFAFKDMRNLLHSVTPNFGLDEVFGVHIDDREGVETAPSIDYPEGKAPVFFFWSRLRCTTAKTLVKYDDGSAFLSENRYGKGRAILAGTEVFSQYNENPQAPASNYLRGLILNCEISRNAILRKEGKDWIGSGVEVTHLAGDSGEAFFIANYSKTDSASFRIVLACGNENWSNMESGEAVDLSREIQLPPLGVLPLIRN